VAALLLHAASPARAQSRAVEGRIVDSVSRVPVAGAALLILDPQNRTLARGLSGTSGFYRVALPTGAARLRVQRLGYRPREFDVSDPVNAIRLGDIAMHPVARFLEPVRADANPICPRRWDQPSALALWEQARAGLLATVIARDEAVADMLLLLHQRLPIGTTDNAPFQYVRFASGRWADAFGTSRTTPDLVDSGFVVGGESGRRSFLGPDATVLLDERFLSAYCFGLARGQDTRPQQVGLQFARGRSRPDRVDIEGTLWVDTLQRRLVDIEYRYVGLERGSAPYRPGGYVRFETMPNGTVLVTQWMIRNVSYVEDTLRGPKSYGESDRARRFYVTEGGAELAHASWADGSDWRASLGRFRLHVMTARSRPIVGAIVVLDSTDYRSLTDSLGMATFEGLLPGPYHATVKDSAFVVLGLANFTGLRFAAMRDTTIEATVVGRTLEDFAPKTCLGNRIVVRAVRSNGMAAGRIEWEIGRDRGRTDGLGLIEYCTAGGAGDSINLRIRDARSSTGWTVVNVILKTGTTPVRVEVAGAR
jgi:hypothetical protein